MAQNTYSSRHVLKVLVWIVLESFLCGRVYGYCLYFKNVFVFDKVGGFMLWRYRPPRGYKLNHLPMTFGRSWYGIVVLSLIPSANINKNILKSFEVAFHVAVLTSLEVIRRHVSKTSYMIWNLPLDIFVGNNFGSPILWMSATTVNTVHLTLKCLFVQYLSHLSC